MKSLKELGDVFSIFHDGTIIEYSGTLPTVTLKISCLYLAEMIDKNYEYFYLTLLNVEKLELQTWPTLKNENGTVLDDLNGIFQVELEILRGKINSEKEIEVNCLHIDSIAEYSGGDLIIKYSDFEIFDHNKNFISIKELEGIATDYWTKLKSV